jgi:threonine dehydratase
MTYAMTFPALCEGLTDFVTVTETEIADAIRLLHETAETNAEGAGAAGLAGLRKLGLAGKRVAIVVSGSNIDDELLRRVLDGSL